VQGRIEEAGVENHLRHYPIHDSLHGVELAQVDEDCAQDGERLPHCRQEEGAVGRGCGAQGDAEAFFWDARESP